MPDWGEYEDPSDVEELADYLSDEDEYDGDPPGYDAPALDESWDCVVTVDNLPVVPKAKEAKLQGVLNKIFGQMGEVTLLKMPFSKEGSSLGFCFVEFRSPEMAAKAVKLTNGRVCDAAARRRRTRRDHAIAASARPPPVLHVRARRYPRRSGARAYTARRDRTTRGSGRMTVGAARGRRAAPRGLHVPRNRPISAGTHRLSRRCVALRSAGTAVVPRVT